MRQEYGEFGDSRRFPPCRDYGSFDIRSRPPLPDLSGKLRDLVTRVLLPVVSASGLVVSSLPSPLSALLSTGLPSSSIKIALKKSDYVEELKEAKALLDDDLINEEDFEKIKKKIIDEL